MTNTAISCLIVDDEAVARDIISTHLAKIPSINIIASCSHAIEANTYLNNYEIDLIFLDINMPDISGIAFAKSIKKDVKIIFTTAYRDYAVEGFQLKAVDYLLKPIAFERLLQAVNTYFEVYDTSETKTKHLTETSTDFMFVRSERRMLKINFNDLVYIESFSDYLKIHLKAETVITRETISAIEAKLPQQKFMRIHRSYIVAIQHISSYTNELITINKQALPISRSYKKEVIDRLEAY
jgi:DNA-binding LytR/AlgR family response regulator